MIRHTATNKVMSVLSKCGKDWSKPYDEWIDLHQQRSAKRDLAAKDLEILENDYALLESASLRLDKFTHTGDKDSNIAMQELKRISVCSVENKAKYTEKRKLLLEELLQLPKSVSFTGKLGGRMMVNHAGGILENAGMALHPWFNFPVIPGSAMKGVARHHAWQAWRQAILAGNTAEAEHLARTIARVFGFPTGDQKPKDQLTETQRVYLDDYGKKLELETTSGSIDFIQALPADDDWKLVVDIVNPHGGNDYTDPVPSFFLAVEKGASFTFVLTSNGLAQEGDMEFAKKHLQGGLSESGVGAKTAAGY
ncbi:MAG: type III-B CRISPR module RAMP protein Cmr6, partial [Victivallales bacterium]|nr:type III-B CRISPR module RAMP protein Cmr6 [Victivallales bacterium]